MALGAVAMCSCLTFSRFYRACEKSSMALYNRVDHIQVTRPGESSEQLRSTANDRFIIIEAQECADCNDCTDEQ